jgi:RHS repeat-associated protein
VKDSGSNVLAAYEYDALARRVERTASGTTTDLYYSQDWQVLEERIGGNARASYVWSPVYVDALVARDRDSDANGSLDERLYAIQDANHNVTSVINTSGAVQERYVYDTFGVRMVKTPSWGSASGSSFAWDRGHQGGPLDGATGNYHYRGRDLRPTIGRWDRVDPIRFDAGDSNLYRYVNNAPTNRVDPSGLFGFGGLSPWYPPLIIPLPAPHPKQAEFLFNLAHLAAGVDPILSKRGRILEDGNFKWPVKFDLSFAGGSLLLPNGQVYGVVGAVNVNLRVNLTVPTGKGLSKHYIAEIEKAYIPKWKDAINRQYNRWRLEPSKPGFKNRTDLIFLHFAVDFRVNNKDKSWQPHVEVAINTAPLVRKKDEHLPPPSFALIWAYNDKHFQGEQYGLVIHELGHLFGLRDEYPDKNAPDRPVPPDKDRSVMYHYWSLNSRILQRHIESIVRMVFDEAARNVNVVPRIDPPRKK